MYTFAIPREEFDETNLNKQTIRKLILKHVSLKEKLHKNMLYYQGEHKIKTDENHKNKLVCNHARDISDTASAYFIFILSGNLGGLRLSFLNGGK